jgi:hypothetical protein
MNKSMEVNSLLKKQNEVIGLTNVNDFQCKLYKSVVCEAIIGTSQS